MKTPKTIYSLKYNIFFVVGLVLFVMLFAITYTPSYGMTETLAETGESVVSDGVTMRWYQHLGICLPVSCAIILLCTCLSRAVLLLTTRTRRLLETEYLLWQTVEIVVTSFFINLFVSLMFHVAYFEYIPYVTLIYLSIAIYPYTIYWLLCERIDRDMRLTMAQRTIIELRQGAANTTKGVVRFSDEKGVVRLVVSANHVVTIEAAGNYATILYEKSGQLVRYSLRNTLKGIEQMCEEGELTRCHRSYYINLEKVRLLKKTPSGLYAEFDIDGVNDIPISATYADNVTQHFSKPTKQ